MTSILGISAFYHDSAACILKNGEIIAAAQEERFTRIKHDSSYPHNAIEFILNFSNLKLSEVDQIVFFEKPFLKFERLLFNLLDFASIDWSSQISPHSAEAIEVAKTGPEKPPEARAPSCASHGAATAAPSSAMRAGACAPERSSCRESSTCVERVAALSATAPGAVSLEPEDPQLARELIRLCDTLPKAPQSAALDQLLRNADAVLAARGEAGYLAGSAFSVADACLLPFLQRVDLPADAAARDDSEPPAEIFVRELSIHPVSAAMTLQMEPIE